MRPYEAHRQISQRRHTKIVQSVHGSYEKSGYNTIKGAFKWDTTDIQKKEKHAMSDI